jgi:hypothetical protein
VRDARERKQQYHVGPWYCPECGAGVDWDVPEPDPVAQVPEAIGTLSGNNKIDRLVLLELDKHRSPVQLVVRGMRFEGIERDCAGDAYFYNEHTCPTNYLTSAEVIMEADDADPHGLFTFTKAVDLDDAMKARICKVGAHAIPADPTDWENALGNLNAEQVRALFEEEVES